MELEGQRVALNDAQLETYTVAFTVNERHCTQTEWVLSGQISAVKLWGGQS